MVDYREAAEQVFRAMAIGGWDHASIGTIQYAVFNKLYFNPPLNWVDVYADYTQYTNWKRIHESAIDLPNGDIVVTIILKVG